MSKIKPNMGSFDRLTRLIVAVLLLSIFFIGNVRGIIGILLIAVSTIYALTSIISFCPFYKPIDFSIYNTSKSHLDE